MRVLFLLDILGQCGHWRSLNWPDAPDTAGRAVEQGRLEPLPAEAALQLELIDCPLAPGDLRHETGGRARVCRAVEAALCVLPGVSRPANCHRLPVRGRGLADDWPGAGLSGLPGLRWAGDHGGAEGEPRVERLQEVCAVQGGGTGHSSQAVKHSPLLSPALRDS